MKTTFLLLAALCAGQMAMAAPDFYLRGYENDWGTRSELKFTENNGVYRLHMDNLTPAMFPAGFKIADASWANQYGTRASFAFDHAMSCVAGDGNNFSFPTNVKSVAGATFVFDYRNTSAPTLTVEPDLYLAGEITGWSNTNTAYKFTEKDGVYTLELPRLSGAFRIAAGISDAWTVEFGGQKNMTAGNTYDCIAGAGNDMTLADGALDDVVLTFNKSSRKLTVATPKAVNTQVETSGLYLAGSMNGWASNNATYKFTRSGDNYELKVTGLTGDFKLVTPDWGVQFGVTSTLDFDKSYPCVIADNGSNMKLSDSSPVDATIKFNLASRTVTVSRTPVPVTYPDFYITGMNGDWGFADSRKFTCADGIYTYRLDKIEASTFPSGFKIATKDWSKQFGSRDAFAYDRTLACVAGDGNNIVPSVSSTAVTITFDYRNASAPTVTLKADPVVSTGKGYYLAGAINNWASDNSAYKFTQTNGKYVLSLARLTGEFKIVTADWSEQYGCSSTISYGQLYSLVQADYGYNMMLADNNGTNIVITFDPAARSVEVRGMPTLYLVGDFNNWSIQNLYAFTYNNGTYTLTTNDFSGRFKVVNDDWSLQFGTNGNDAFGTDRAYPLFTVGGSDGDINFWGAGSRVKLTLRTDDAARLRSFADMIPMEDDIITEDAPVEYYNLQGVRVEHPSNGIFIRRCGNKVDKIAVK